MIYRMLITDAGRKAIAECVSAQKHLRLTEIALGDGGGAPTTPKATQTELVREVWRDAVDRVVPLEDRPTNILIEKRIASTEGGWTAREVGVFDDAGTLVAVGNMPESYKPVLDEGTTREMIVRIVVDVGVEAVCDIVIAESILLETGKYECNVLTREEYDELAASGQLNGSVIYFVKGNTDFKEALENLEESVASLHAAFAELSATHADDKAALEGTIQAASDALDAAFAEATAAIEAQGSKHDADTAAATVRMNNIALSLQSLSTTVSAVSAKVDENTSGVSTNASLISALTGRIDLLGEALDSLSTSTSERDDENNAVAQSLSERLGAVENKNSEQDLSIATNADGISALGARLDVALNEDIPALLGAYTDAIADLQAKSGVATTAFSGTSKLSTATVMGVNDGKVGHDTNGALRVASATAEVKGAVYLPESEASTLTSAAASLELLRTKATASSVACGATASSDNCNQYSFVGPLSSLGVTGAAADINSVTFYRRANATPNGATQVYLRLLKKTVGADGTAAWQIASQSVNAVAFSAQPINGDKCGTFYMRRVAGVEPPTCAETVALVMVGAADAEVNTSLQFGCKVVASTTGGVCVSIPIGDAVTSDKGGLAVVPLVDVTWTPCAPAVGTASYDAPGVVQLSLAATLIDDPLGIGKQADGRIVCDMAQVRAVVNAAVAGVAAALEARVAELETAKADLEARVAALEGQGNG